MYINYNIFMFLGFHLFKYFRQRLNQTNKTSSQSVDLYYNHFRFKPILVGLPDQ